MESMILLRECPFKFKGGGGGGAMFFPEKN
jgi:hypothetical protein